MFRLLAEILGTLQGILAEEVKQTAEEIKQTELLKKIETSLAENPAVSLQIKLGTPISK